ncbi:MAG: sigma-70 family RNA polymerase sigma factor [Firmicutes bacterium]|nr:sigma-70 family RNA polymerase sigma factor [Bacillota bacterium]
MKKLTASDMEYIEGLYREMYTLLFSYAKRVLQKEALAEEAVQETFVTACQRLDSIKSSPNPQGWIMNTLKYITRRIQEARNLHSRYLFLDESALNIPDPTAHYKDPALLYDGLVSQEDYYLLSRTGIDGCSTLELAKELGISLAACRKRIQRARERFRAQYGREYKKKEKARLGVTKKTQSRIYD